MPGSGLRLSLPTAAALAIAVVDSFLLDLGAVGAVVGCAAVLTVAYHRMLFRLVARPVGMAAGTVAGMTLTREQKLRATMAIVGIGFCAIVVYLYVQVRFCETKTLESTFLPSPLSRFCDFYCVHDIWTRCQFTGVGYGLTYFPCTYLFVEPFSHFPSPYSGVTVFLALYLVFMCAYAFLNVRTDSLSESAKNLVMCLVSYPFLFTVQTANFEVVIFASLVLFVHFYRQRRAPVLTGLLLGIPVAMKPFPAVFLILPLSDRRYKEFFYALGWAAVLTITPLLLFEGGIRDGLSGYVERLKASLAMYQELFITHGAGIHYGHTLFGALRILAPQLNSPESFPHLLALYLAFSVIAFGAVSLYIVRREVLLWKKVALLVICMNFLPYVSGDYKLIHFFIPLFLFINSAREDKLDLLFVVLFGLVLIPKGYVSFATSPLHTLNEVINPLLMVGMAGLIIVPGLLKRRAVLASGRDAGHPAAEGEIAPCAIVPMPSDRRSPPSAGDAQGLRLAG